MLGSCRQGVFPASARVDALGLSEWRRVFAVNADADLLLLRCGASISPARSSERRVAWSSSPRRTIPAPGPVGAVAYSAVEGRADPTGLRVAALEWGASRDPASTHSASQRRIRYRHLDRRGDQRTSRPVRADALSNTALAECPRRRGCKQRRRGAGGRDVRRCVPRRPRAPRCLSMAGTELGHMTATARRPEIA